MAKGYWIAGVDINTQADYDEYRKRNAVAFAKFGGKFLVRGGPHECVFGRSRQHPVVIEFPTHEAALACYRSPEYAAAKKLREGASVADIVVLEGYDGQQP